MEQTLHSFKLSLTDISKEIKARECWEKVKVIPQPNQIELRGEEAKGKKKTHTNMTKREETWESEALLLLPQSGNYC